ncbi:MAG: NAD(P)H-hydrate dehydratase [Campylobacterota bacterium]|nr:NAD(P)H-hydrate dehydratase [Campylobacterota bacterium]
MQNIYNEVASLDKRCYKQFELSEDILMEHAADGMADYIRSHHNDEDKIIIVCGAGNNGADGIVLARLLMIDYEVSIIMPFGVKSPMCHLQLRRANALHVNIIDTLEPCDIIVDALFGSGFSGTFNDKTQILLQQMNSIDARKIACDMPSGLHLDGTLEDSSFRADITLTMGALKRGMYSDKAKEMVGEIRVLDLGISRHLYEVESSWQLLDLDDLNLPHRNAQNSHKGSYGHLSVVCGEKEGAAVITALAALRFGAGLVTLVSNENVTIPYELMQSHFIPSNTSAIALGMGLGQEFSENELNDFLAKESPLIIDADIFSHPMLLELLKREELILTPHPKEFTLLYKACGLGDISIETLQNNRFKYLEHFCELYPDITLLLKGANVIIGKDRQFFINPHGNNILSKGGSGDVLAGMIGALLAQGITPLDAAIHASLAHTKAALSLTCNTYAMTPNDLIESLKTL